MANRITVDEPIVQVTVVEDNVSVNICENNVKVETSTTGPQGPRGTQFLSGSVDPSSIIGLIGDQYLNTTTGYLFGPKTELGWGTGILVQFGLTIDEIYYEHNQLVPSSIWNISHPLLFKPNVAIIDTSGNEIIAECQYLGSTIILTFSQPIAGKAYLS
jgi:hypothetical protein